MGLGELLGEWCSQTVNFLSFLLPTARCTTTTAEHGKVDVLHLLTSKRWRDADVQEELLVAQLIPLF